MLEVAPSVVSMVLQLSKVTETAFILKTSRRQYLHNGYY